MYEVLEREREQQRVPQYTNTPYSNVQYGQQQTVRPMNSYAPSYNQPQSYEQGYSQRNYGYTQQNNYSGNVSNVNMYDAAMVAQNARNFASAPTYQPSYYAEPQAYNNISARAKTHPTNFYGQRQAPATNYYNQVAPTMAPAQVEIAKVAPAKKRINNKMTKVLIAVYFCIIAICAALILINVVTATSGTAAAATTGVTAPTYTPNEIYYSVSEDGTITELAETKAVVNYEYDNSTNWFDKMCDAIGNLLG